MKTYIPILLVLLSALIVGCESLFIPPNPPQTPQRIFDTAWTFADEEYSFFSFKGIDWDEVRTRYAPLIEEDMSDEALFDVIADMLFEFRDGHVNLSTPFDVSRNWTWYLNSPPNYDYNLLERNYFLGDEQFGRGMIFYDFGDVGYVSYRSFSTGLSRGGMDFLVEKYADRKGIIIDIRDNGGGELTNAFTLASAFTKDTVMFGRLRSRNGPAHEDFTAWRDQFIEPDPEDTVFLKPVVLLTNRSSYSASTFFTQMMRELPNVTVMGDTTGGGGGAPAVTDLPNGWVLRVSSTQLVAPDGFNVEDGIPPDELVYIDPDDEANGIDTILEAALEFLRR